MHAGLGQIARLTGFSEVTTRQILSNRGDRYSECVREDRRLHGRYTITAAAHADRGHTEVGS
jgi:hypothetical protein